MANEFVVDLKLTGFKEFEEVMVQIGKEFGYTEAAKKVLVPAMRDALQPIKTSIASVPIPFDPKGTGEKHLNQTLRSYARIPRNSDKKSKYIGNNTAVVGIVSVKKPQVAISQEFGNARVPAKPYLRVGLARATISAVNILGNKLGERLQKYKAKKAKK